MGAIQDVLTKFGIDTVDLIKSNILNSGKSATGGTANSIRSNLVATNRLVVDAPRYIDVLETGRGPGKPPPKDSIIAWVQARQIPIRRTIDDATNAIRFSIAKSGTKLFQSGGRKDIITPALAEERFNSLSEQIADISLSLLLKKIDDSLKK